MATFYLAGSVDRVPVHPDMLHALKLLDRRFHVGLEFNVPAKWHEKRVQVDALIACTGPEGWLRVVEVKGELRGMLTGPMTGPWRQNGERVDANRNPFEQVVRTADAFDWYLKHEWRNNIEHRGVYRSVILPQADPASRLMAPPFVRFLFSYGSLVDDLFTFRPRDYRISLDGGRITGLMNQLGLRRKQRINGVEMDGPHDGEAAERRIRRRMAEIRTALDGVERDLSIVAAARPGEADARQSRQPADERVRPKGGRVSEPTPPAFPAGAAIADDAGTLGAPDGIAFEVDPVDAACLAIASAASSILASGRTAGAAAAYGNAKQSAPFDYKSLGFKRLKDLLAEGERRGHFGVREVDGGNPTLFVAR